MQISQGTPPLRTASEFYEKAALKKVARFTGEHLCCSLFLIKLQALLEKDSNTGVFLWILRNFQEHLLSRTPMLEVFQIWN